MRKSRPSGRGTGDEHIDLQFSFLCTEELLRSIAKDNSGIGGSGGGDHALDKLLEVSLFCIAERVLHPCASNDRSMSISTTRVPFDQKRDRHQNAEAGHAPG